MRTRQEHLEFCKQRAMEYVHARDLTNAITSMLSDLSKHPETAEIGESLGLLGIMAAANGNTEDCIRFITGFR